MKRFSCLFLLTLPLAACATQPQPAHRELQMVNISAVAAPDTQNLMQFAVERHVEPCPGFMNTIDAAEHAVDTAPRHYPHML